MSLDVKENSPSGNSNLLEEEVADLEMAELSPVEQEESLALQILLEARERYDAYEAVSNTVEQNVALSEFIVELPDPDSLIDSDSIT